MSALPLKKACADDVNGMSKKSATLATEPLAAAAASVEDLSMTMTSPVTMSATTRQLLCRRSPAAHSCARVRAGFQLRLR